MKKRQWQFNWKITLFTGLFLPLLIGLGFWQLQRASEKEQIQIQFDQKMQQMPQDITTIDKQTSATALAFLPVTITGAIDNEHYFLLDNRVVEGKTGFEVISPLTTQQGETYLINRGWIPAKATRQELPDVTPIKNTITLQGYIYVPAGHTFTLGADETTQQWPKIISDADAPLIGKRLHKAVFPYTIRVSQELNDGLIRHWPAVNMTSAKHIAYAVQWFSMALALVILFIASSWRVSEEE
jgi:cytochrome oxidase assembly protein ShyY1